VGALSARLTGIDRRSSNRTVGVDLLKPNDVARRLAVSRSWVYEAASAGRIPSVRIGGEHGPLRFVPEDIDAWLAESRATWTPGARPGADHRRRPQSPVLRTRQMHTSAGRVADGDQQSLL
jgi:excisionase family DNA binding protein